MTRFLNSAEGGTNGIDVTAGNSGGSSGQAIRVGVSGTSRVTYSTDHPTRGSMGFKIANAAGAQAALRTPAGLSSMNFSASYDFRIDAALPAATWEWVDVLNVGGDHVFKLFVNPDGTVRGRMRNAASNTAALQSTAGGALAADTDYRLDINVIPGTGVADGTLAWRVCLRGSNTPVTGMNVTSAVMDAGTTAIVDCLLGQPENHAAAITTYGDDFQWDDAAAGAFIGLVTGPANQPPVIITPANQLIQAGSAATLTMVATDVDGSIASASWAPQSWPSAASTPTFASGAATQSAVTNALSVPGIYLFLPDAIDNSGAHPTSVTPAIVGVYAADGSTKVRSQRSNTGGWSGIIDYLNDVSQASFFESPGGPVNSPTIVDMDPVKPGDFTVDHFEAEISPVGGAPSTCKLDVLNGSAATVIATRTVALTDSWVDTPIALTSGENAAFTDHIIWGIRLTANQT